MTNSTEAPAVLGPVQQQVRPQRTEWREIADALRREYGYPYTSNGEPRLDFSKHVYVGRAGSLLLKAEKQEAVMRAALLLAKRMCEEALPKFDWGASCLDANAIDLLNRAPAAIASALGPNRL